MTDAPSDPPPAEPTADPAGSTTTGPHAAGPIAQTPSQARVFRRNPDGPVGGVATGIADYVGIDPTIVKIAVAIAVAASQGAALLAYVAAWALIPTKYEDTTSRRFVTKDSVSPQSMLILGVALAIAVGVAIDAIVDPGSTLFVPGLLLLGGYYLLNQRDRSASEHLATAVAPPPPPGTATPPPPGTVTPPPPTAASNSTYGWAVPKVDDETSSTANESRRAPDVPEEPTPPITAMTLAAAAAGIAALALINGLVSAELGSAAFIGLATAIIGVGIVVASVLGRARALIPLGILSASSLVVAPIIDTAITGGFGAREISVTNEAALQDEYTLGAGAFELDLSELTLTEDRTIELDIGAGAAQIRVPSDMNVELIASNTAGYIGVVPPIQRLDSPADGDDSADPADLVDPAESVDANGSSDGVGSEDGDGSQGGDGVGDFSFEIDGFEIEGTRVESPVIPIPGSTSSWPTEEIAGVDSNYRWSQSIDDGPTLTIVANLTYGALEVVR